jgi:tetratricopeptide (TPR) repeat protein
MRERWLILAATVLLAAARSAGAQIPEKFENLKVLPKDISRDQLTAVMRGFALGLGVRCQYCHEQKPGAQGDGLDAFDFKADAKPTKDKARLMMRMVGTINDSILAKLPERAEPAVGVGCVTCHRGLPLPRTLEATLAMTIQKHGVDSAVVQYRRLRDESLALGRYNFGENTLAELARQLAPTNADAALRVLGLNQEFFPASANIDYQIAEIHRTRGERELAIARYRKALEKAPNHPQAKRRLEELAQ